MTELRETIREPLLDLMAQFAALRDPASPKRAVWVSKGTPLPAFLRGWEPTLKLPEGILVANDVTHCLLLAAARTEEALAQILDYIEPKSALKADAIEHLPVVQAQDADGGVIWEQATSFARVGEARLRATLYGRVVMTTLPELLARRLRLIEREEWHARQVATAAAPRSPAASRGRR